MNAAKKAAKRLETRRNAFDEHGKNPSNSSGQGHDMHRPGSQKK